MMKTLERQQDQPNKICQVKDCQRPALRDESLCAFHYYQLPRDTRQALAIQDEKAKHRNRRLVRFVRGGQPLEHIHITII